MTKTRFGKLWRHIFILKIFLQLYGDYKQHIIKLLCILLQENQKFYFKFKNEFILIFFKKYFRKGCHPVQKFLCLI